MNQQSEPMALNEETLAKIETLLMPHSADSGVMAGFRRDFPGLSFTQCDESDMLVEQPFREYPRFNLYLVDASEHCWRLTADLARATGLVVARK